MLDQILSRVRTMIPASLFKIAQPTYHFLFAWIAAIWYGFSSRNMTVVGVTGTNGKTTTIALLHEMLANGGIAVASLSSLRFKIKNREEKNMLKMTMPGRFRLQKFLYDSKKSGCTHIVLEVTSEGIKQFRHCGIWFRVAILTNVTPEHIESHGSFDAYRASKAQLFKKSPVHILNGEDKNIEYFLTIPARERIVYTTKDLPTRLPRPLLGMFNIQNITAAYTAARYFGVAPDAIERALENFPGVPGRLEFVQKEPFAVVVDYAHTPDALSHVYRLLKSNEQFAGRHKLICVLGSAGGGRDRWKRPEMGAVAAEFCDEIFLTNEDPYDENQRGIIDDIAKGMHNSGKSNNPSTVILDRRDAIQRAIKRATPQDTVIITGKGAEPWMMLDGGKKISWDDREIARAALKNNS